MKKKRNEFIVIFFCFFYLVTFYASGQTLPFKHYSVEQGLVSSFVRCIFQDSKGFLWIGTQQGISRFNGIEFQNFYVSDGLTDDLIIDINEDSKGNIWIGTGGGGAACFHEGKFTAYTTKNGLPDNRITSIVEDQEGNLWLGTFAGVSKFNGKEFILYREKDGLSSEMINDILIDRNGYTWLATKKGLSCFKDKKFINYNTHNGLIHHSVQVLMADAKGNLWIGTEKGLTCREYQSKTFTSYSTKNGMSSNFVKSLYDCGNGNILIGTDKGISLFSSGKFTNYNMEHGLPNDKVFTIYGDREGNTWFGTLLGLSRLHSFSFVNFSDNDGLPSKLVWTIAEDRRGWFWFGTENGLSCYAKGKIKNFTTKDGLINNSIYKIIVTRTGELWMGTDGGVCVYSPLSGTFKNYSVDDGLPHHVVISLAEDREGVIWIGTVRGLYRFIKGKFLPPGFKQETAPIHNILEDKNGNIWFTKRGKVCKILKDKDQVIYYSSRDGLIYDDINSLFADSRGRTWIATKQGLSCFSNGKFTNYTTADGLSDNTCYFVLEDDNHYLWIGTGKGVNRFDGKSFKIYTASNGLASDQTVQDCCLKDSRGYLWFGSVKGVSRFDPKLDRVNTVPPPVYITNFQIMGNPYPLPRGNDLQLGYKQNFLTFDFIGISLTSPQDVIYKYRLESIDKNWLETRNRNVSYHYLRPGNYHFKVIAVSKEGIESLQAAEIGFRILPPFWETWWFRGMLVAAFLALMVSFLMWRIKREKEKAVNQERNKQLMMAQKMELLGILAGGAIHDLKNLLSVIITYSKIAAQEAHEDNKKIKPLETIKNTATTAVQVVKQILAFTRQGYDKTVAANLPDLLAEIIEILKVTIPPGVTIQWEPPAEEILFHINPTRFQQMVMNLCLNALQAMPQGGKLDIQLHKDRDKQVILEVSDTGTGIEDEIINKIFDPLFTTKEPGKGTGLGLFVVKQILAEYQGKITVQSKPGQGTAFQLFLPCPGPKAP